MRKQETSEVQAALRELRSTYQRAGLRKKLGVAAGQFFRWCVRTAFVRKALASLRTEEGTLKKYDRMAGAYVAAYEEAQSENPRRLAVYDNEIQFVSVKELQEAIIQNIVGQIFRPLELKNCTLLEVGAGELTTLVPLAKSAPWISSISALELSWSRITVGKRFAEAQGVTPEHLVCGTACHLPFSNASFDVVFTCHCLEQANFDKYQILSELNRVARSYVVMLEPSWELGDKHQKRRIESKGFLRKLDAAIDKMGCNLVRHELLPHAGSPYNRTAAYVIKKGGATDIAMQDDVLACPHCRSTVVRHGDFYFCRFCGHLYPIVAGIPCMHPSNAILATRYEDLVATQVIKSGIKEQRSALDS